MQMEAASFPLTMMYSKTPRRHQDSGCQTQQRTPRKGEGIEAGIGGQQDHQNEHANNVIGSKRIHVTIQMIPHTSRERSNLFTTRPMLFYKANDQMQPTFG